MIPPETNDKLSGALADWRLAPRRNPQFRTEVWARLEKARRAPSWPGYVRDHAALVAGALAVAVVIGALTGRAQARARAEADSNRIADSYVRALDARAMRLP